MLKKRITAILMAVAMIVTLMPSATVTTKVEAASSSPNRRVVGYFPSYRMGTINSVDFSALSHCILAFMTYANGTLTSGFSAGDAQTVVSKCHANGAKALIAVGGWNGFNTDDGAFNDAGRRTSIINQIMNYIDTYNLDGVDLDLEVNDGNVWNYFDAFCSELSSRLKQKGKLLTMAVSPWFTNPIANSTYNYFDFINLMAYDEHQGDGPLASSSFVNNMISYYSSRGVSNDRMTIGVPFYGFGAGGTAYTYAEILAMNSANSTRDEYNGIYYNGATTIRQKAEMSKSYGGTMIWELGQDSFGSGSLLAVIKDVMASGTDTTTQASTTKAPTDGYTAVTPSVSDWQNWGKWSTYFGLWDGVSATGAVKNGHNLNGFSMKIDNAIGEWSIQARTANIGVEQGAQYQYKMVINSSKQGVRLGVKEDLTNSSAQLEMTTLNSGSNTVTGTFTANGSDVQLLLSLGYGENSGATVTVTDLTLTKIGSETTPQPTTPQATTTPLADGYTAVTPSVSDWQNWGKWSTYFGLWDALSATGAVKNGNSLEGFSMQIDNAIGEWSIQAKTDNISTENGAEYRYQMVINSSKQGVRLGVKEDLINNTSNLEMTTLNSGDNTVTGTFTANGNNIQLLLSLGYGENSGSTVTVKSLSLTKISDPTQTSSQVTETTRPQQESSEVVETTTPNTGVSAPTGLTNTGGSTFQWNRVENATLYEVYLNGVLENRVVATSYTFPVYKLSNPGSYMIGVVAVNGEQKSSMTTVMFNVDGPTETTTPETSPNNETTKKPIHDGNQNPDNAALTYSGWDTVAFTGSSLADAVNKYKFVVADGKADIVNIQMPGFATAPGAYVTFADADFGNMTVNGANLSKDIQGAGIIIQLKNFTYKYNEVKIENGSGSTKAVIYVYYADGLDNLTGEPDTTTVEETTPQETTPQETTPQETAPQETEKQTEETTKESVSEELTETETAEETTKETGTELNTTAEVTTVNNDDTTTEEQTESQNNPYEEWGFNPANLSYEQVSCTGTESEEPIGFAVKDSTIEGLNPWYGDGGNTFMLQYADIDDEGVKATVTINGGEVADGIVTEKARGLVKLNPNKLADNAYTMVTVTLDSGKSTTFVVKKGNPNVEPTTTKEDTTVADGNTTAAGEVTSADDKTSENQETSDEVSEQDSKEETTTENQYSDWEFNPADLTYTDVECNGSEDTQEALGYSAKEATLEGITPWYGDGGNTFMIQYADPDDEGVGATVTINGEEAAEGVVKETARGLVKIAPTSLPDNSYTLLQVTLPSGKNATFVIKKGNPQVEPSTTAEDATTDSAETQDTTTTVNEDTTSTETDTQDVTTPQAGTTDVGETQSVDVENPTDESTPVQEETSSDEQEMTSGREPATTRPVETTEKPSETTTKERTTTTKSNEDRPTTSKQAATTTSQDITTADTATVATTAASTAKASVSIGKTTVTKATKKKTAKKVKISLKNVQGANGYQIAIYKTKSNASKNVKALVKKYYKKANATVKSAKFKKTKKLFARARAYRFVDGTTYFGAWSAVKKVKIK